MSTSAKLVAALALGAAVAAPLALAAQTSGELRTETINNVTIVNGGVGIDEAGLVKSMALRYPLRVVISGRGGDCHVGDRMSISRAGRLVAEVDDAGPWLLLDLPPWPTTAAASRDPSGMPSPRHRTG